MIKNKKSQPEQTRRYFLSLQMENRCRSKLQSITSIWSNKKALETIMVLKMVLLALFLAGASLGIYFLVSGLRG